MKYKEAFTLIELITVVIILGILVMIAMPQYNYVVERSRSAEGVSVIGALRTAMIRYYVEHSGIYAEDPAHLDTEVPSMRFFEGLDVGSDLNTVIIGNQIAKVVRDPDEQYSFGPANIYTLYIDDEGNISCDGYQTLCTKMGY